MRILAGCISAVQCIVFLRPCLYAHRPGSLETSSEQHHVQNASSANQLPDCSTTESVSEPKTALGRPPSGSAAGYNDQHGCRGTEGMSTSRSVQTSATGERHQWQAESVGKLFDKELDNHHEENLLLAQVAKGLISP